MGVLVPEIGDPIKRVLRIPSDQEIVYFGIMGYPKEEVEQDFPKLEALTYSEQWGETIHRTAHPPGTVSNALGNFSQTEK